MDRQTEPYDITSITVQYVYIGRQPELRDTASLDSAIVLSELSRACDTTGGGVRFIRKVHDCVG